MNETELRSKIANWLVPYIGIAEGSAEHKAIIDCFNTSKLCTRHKMTTKDSWCATTVSVVFIMNMMAGSAGSDKLFECVECSCGNMIELAKAQGIWVEADNHIPKIGDVIMYDWQDNNISIGNNTGWPDHVGIVSHVNGNTFKVIEGNVKNTVGYRTMKVNGKYIRGFIVPKYEKFSTPDPNAIKDSDPSKIVKFKGIVTANLNVRSYAGTENQILRKLSKGTVVEVCDTVIDKNGDGWYYIKESGKYGFVSANYIEQEGSSNTNTSTVLNRTCKFTGVVAANKLNVRSYAGTSYDKLRVLEKDTIVEVCDEVKDSTGKIWYYIKESGKYGFVSSEYIARC